MKEKTKITTDDVGVVSSGTFASSSVRGNASLARRIEHAMSMAVRVAMDAGITDPEETRQLMLAARRHVLEQARGTR